MFKKIVLGSFGLLISYISFAQSIPAAKEDSKKLVGDIGIAAFQNASITNSKEGGASNTKRSERKITTNSTF